MTVNSSVSRRAWIGAAASGVFVLLGGKRMWNAAPAIKHTINVYASPSCDCCHKWMEPLEKNGFEVSRHMMDDVTPKKKELGVPEALWSCHTGIANGYVVEGHVPADLVVKMLTEKPAIAGLAAPGMPASAPGMDIGHEKYSIISFTKKGATAVYAVRS